jgi:hypothetical protein
MYSGEEDEATTETTDADEMQRRYPWYLDIWLYPLGRNTPIMVAILEGGPMALATLAGLSWGAVMIAPLLLPFAMVIIFTCLIGLLLMALYLVWYICECVRDSSQGHVRAPDTINSTPSHIELLSQSATIIISTLMSWLPVMLCFYYQAPPIWCWSILALVAYGYPMIFLRCVIHESFTGLNVFALPLRILRTFLPYTAVALVLNLYLAGLYGLSIVLAPVFSLEPARAWILGPLCLLVPVINLGPLYFTLVIAHILGSFYARYETQVV